jgi:hypothetical protein
LPSSWAAATIGSIIEGRLSLRRSISIGLDLATSGPFNPGNSL